MTETQRDKILDEWLVQHKGLIFKIVRAFANTQMDQDDLFQEIIIHIWHSIPSFRHKSAVSTWMYRIALNTAISWTKKERKHSNAQRLEEAESVLLVNQQPSDERLLWLYQEIYKLNEIDRSIALLLLEGFSYKEMSGILGISESNVGVKINRIKKFLISKSKNYDHHGIQ